MNEGHGLELVMYLAQAGCATAQAAIFAYYYRVSRLEHLRLWGLSFIALALYLVFALVGTNLGEPQVALLALGTMAVLGRHPPTPKMIRSVLIASALFGAITALLFAAPASIATHRVVLHSALRYAVTGAGYLIVSILLWRRARRSGLGARRSEE